MNLNHRLGPSSALVADLSLLISQRASGPGWLIQMLATLSRHNTRWFDVRMERVLSSCQDDQMLSVDVNLTSWLLPPDLSWSGVLDLYGRRISPMYRSLRRVVEEDIENISILLSELDPQLQETDREKHLCRLDGNSSPPPDSSSDHPPERQKRKRQRSSLESPVIRPSDPLLPTIVITPCPPQPRETSCWVPYQDASFGGRLTIPTYAALNSSHPPMTDVLASASRLDKWEYVEGHWTVFGPRRKLTFFMSLRALLYAYVLGGLTFVPLVILLLIGITIYTSVPAGEALGSTKVTKSQSDPNHVKDACDQDPPPDVNDLPKTRKSWLTVRRTFEESTFDGSYVTLVRSYLDSRSKDPKRSRPKDMWYVVLKGKVLYLYEDESMTECEAAIELGGHDVVIYPEGLLDGELFTKRNAICLKPRLKKDAGQGMPSVTKEMAMDSPVGDDKGEAGGNRKKRSKEREDKVRDAVVEEAFTAPWFIFVRSCVEMEDWYLSLVHASDHPAGTPTLHPLQSVFLPSEMNQLVNTLDEQPDVIPMRWLNALLGRVFFSFYRTQVLESYIIGRLMKKLSKVKRPTFLTDIAVTQFSIGNKAPTLSKPMLKELTKEGDASLEVGLSYKGEIRATVQATAVINLGARFKSYTVKLVLAVVLRELEGNLLVKVKRPPSSRIWYAFTKPPRMVINVEPIVSDRQITWNMILSTIESRIEEIIIDSVVMPNMDDTSFFDSSDYAHRGGLWSDAARSEKPMVANGEDKEPKDLIPEVDAPPLTDETEQKTLPRTKSAEELTAETSPLDGIPVVRSATLMSSPEQSTKTAGRRSWFASPVADELDNEVIREEEDPGVVRGRRSRAASLAQKPGGNSTSPPSSEPAVPTSDPLVDDGHDVYGYLSPQFPSRSSQGHSRSSRTHSISSSVGGDDLSDSSATSRGPRHSLGTSTTSSLFSTLKSKAADKQALSNSAKEAIRKWGANWGGLKKDSHENATQDEVPDAGPSAHRTRAESTHTRASYADVRAAVGERKERGKLEEASAPMPIQGKARSHSSSSGRMASPSGNSGSPASSSSIQEGTSVKATGTPLSRSLGENTSSDPFKGRDFANDTDEYSAPSLIHTQPSQARTMTIPGIHASHRGEIMSMGNVAAASPLPESKPKGPTIQSVYRLWKSPILSGQQHTPEPHSDGTERNHDITPLSLSPEIDSPPPRLVPPPLPPRTIPSVAVRHTAEASDDRLAELATSPASQALKSIASRDENKRASLDLSALANGTDITQHVQQPRVPAASDDRPPLPPRRIQASA
ncbi:hypothetical protein F5I97DRAFT_1928045 [Phlebopus sp. FC_14]|nr:hypothetical protein F5I97DRAFT_1928045 [Phlebopus sp. FC_14]